MNPSAGSFFSWKELTWAGSCKKSSAGWAAPQQSWVQGGSILESFSKGFCFKNPNILGHISLPPLWNTETKIQGVFFVFALLVLGCFSFPQSLTYKMWYLHYKNLIFFLTRIDSEAKCFSKMGRAWLGSVFTGGWECHSPIFPIFPLISELLLPWGCTKVQRGGFDRRKTLKSDKNPELNGRWKGQSWGRASSEATEPPWNSGIGAGPSLVTFSVSDATQNSCFLSGRWHSARKCSQGGLKF